MDNTILFGTVAIVVALMIRRAFAFRAIRKKVPEYLKADAIILDVRSAGEYNAGHVERSVNIPLHELTHRVKELDAQKTILVCCASGTRSGVAASLLRTKGFKKALNAGPWSNLIAGTDFR